MSGERFRARAKTVQKLGRDGLVERDLATGGERRISQRTADIPLGPARPQGQTADHCALLRSGGRSAVPARGRWRRPRQAAEGTACAALGPTSTPGPPVPDVPWIAADAPMMAAPVTSEDMLPPPAPRRRCEHAGRKESKRRKSGRPAPDGARSAAPGEQRRSRLMDDGGGRSRFESAAEDAAQDLDPEQSAEARRAVKKRQVMDHAADAARSEDSQQTGPPALMEDGADVRQCDGPQLGRETPEPAAVPDDRTAYKKRQAAKSTARSAVSDPSARRLRSEAPPPAADSAPGSTSTGDPIKGDAAPSSRSYQRAVRRGGRAEQKAGQAQDDLPAKRRLSFRPGPDGEAGRSRRRLHFEQDVLPEYRKPSLSARVGDMVKTAAVMELHGEIHESEQQDVAVEATYKSGLFMEQGVGRALRWQRDCRRSKIHRALCQADRCAAKEDLDLAWQAARRDGLGSQRKNALTKWMQKQKLKRKYARAAHEAKQTAQFTQNVTRATGQIVRAVRQYAAARRSLLAVVAMLAMVAVSFSAGMTSCAAMLSGLQSSYISASYMADEQDICEARLYYTKLETDLQMDIDKTERDRPGYDEYRYDIGEIGHDPYELMGYLSTMFDAFTFAQVQAEIMRLFGEQYQLTREVIVETRYDSDGDPYDWYVLQTTLTVRPLSGIIAGSLSLGEQTDRYGVYQQTLGNRQAYGAPFDFPWLDHVSSDYGWRVHPISGEKDLHRGVDIAVAQGTPIKAIHDGKVISAGDAGGYGLCVVIEDEKGYRSRYAHCASLSVTVGQEVQRGDMIAAVGSTGNSTGPHLHLEVMLDGEYLDPYYFVDTGGGAQWDGP